MSSFLLIWIILSVAFVLLVCVRCSFCFYFLAIVPVVFLGLFFAFRHHPNTGYHKEEFFSNFTLGGHRGSPHHAPENSLSSIQKAVEEGCQLVEFDIQLSSDSVAVLMHDDDTSRVSETKLNVSRSNSQTLFQVELKPVNGVNDTIPSLARVVDWCRERKIKMIFDVKDGDTKVISDIARMIDEKKLHSLVIVSSFNPFVPYLLKWHDSRILTGFTNRRGYHSMEAESGNNPRGHFMYQWALECIDSFVHLGIETFLYPRFLGVDMLLLNHRDISIELVSQARQFDIHLVAWTVNDEDEMIWFRDVVKMPFLTDAPYKVK